MIKNNMIDSGIPIIGSLALGSHFCKFYETKKDLKDILSAFFRAGIENNEVCILVTSEVFTSEEAIQFFSKEIPHFDFLRAQQQIKIIDQKDALSGIHTNQIDNVLNSWFELEKNALSKGYSGLRITECTCFLNGKQWCNLLDFETKITGAIDQHNIVVLCCFDITHSDAMSVIEIVKNHEFALVQQNNQWQMIENSSIKMLKNQLYEINQELEQRVKSRTLDLEAALQMRDQFFSIASHDLKTPITSLQLYVDGLLHAKLKDSNVPEHFVAILKKIHEQCFRLDKLINNLLDVTRIMKEGKFFIEPERVDFTALLQDVLERFQYEFKKAGCIVHLHALSSIMGYWDPIRLDQLISNLFSNAIKYAEGKPIHISLNQRNERIVLKIQDQGIGIAATDQKFIFDRFIQLGETHKHNSGFGLGLWIVQQIVHAHEGSISVESDTGKGAIFTVELPCDLNTRNTFNIKNKVLLSS